MKVIGDALGVDSSIFLDDRLTCASLFEEAYLESDAAQ